jgi:hypothetical protein
MKSFEGLSEIRKYLSHDFDANVVKVKGGKIGGLEVGSEDSLGLLFVEELLCEEGTVLLMEFAHLKK